MTFLEWIKTIETRLDIKTLCLNTSALRKRRPQFHIESPVFAQTHGHKEGLYGATASLYNRYKGNIDDQGLGSAGKFATHKGFHPGTCTDAQSHPITITENNKNVYMVLYFIISFCCCPINVDKVILKSPKHFIYGDEYLNF